MIPALGFSIYSVFSARKLQNDIISFKEAFTAYFLCIAIGYLIVQQGRKVNLKYIFKYTTLLLVFLSAGMVAYGTHELEEYLVKSDQIKKEEIYRPWDILQPINDGDYHPMHDKGIIGVFLKGFFGYNSNPNVIELVLWIAALMFGMNMWRRFYL